MRNTKGQFIKGHKEGVRFEKDHTPWNKGVTGYKFREDYIPWNLGKKLSLEKSTKVIISCKSCKKEIIDFPSNKRVYCSRFCRSKFLSTLTGKKALNWQGGIVRGNRHRARKHGKEGYYTFAEWENLKKFYSYMCLCCKRTEPEISLTEDHIVPISRGGDNTINNIQPLCMGCNKKKFTQSTDYRSNFIREAVF